MKQYKSLSLICILQNCWLTLCRPETPKWVLWQKAKTPDEMPHNAAFHQGLQCLQTQNQPSEKYQFWGIINCDPSIYTMNKPEWIVCNFMQT